MNKYNAEKGIGKDKPALTRSRRLVVESAPTRARRAVKEDTPAVSGIGDKPKARTTAVLGIRNHPKTPATSKRKTKRPRVDTDDDDGGDASLDENGFPYGSWESHVEEVESLSEKADDKDGIPVRCGTVRWLDGRKTLHTLTTLHQKCPRIMCSYYEMHLVFKVADAAALDLADPGPEIKSEGGSRASRAPSDSIPATTGSPSTKSPYTRRTRA